MNVRDRVAHNIIDLRHERGMSQEALADKADVSRAYVGKLENAKFSATIDLLQRMAAALDVDISRTHPFQIAAVCFRTVQEKS